jgi:hypothetical protein
VSLHRDVTLALGETVTCDLELAPVASDPPYDWLEGEFLGEFKRGFELRRFVPDGEEVSDSAGRARVVRDAWVEFAAPELNKSLDTWHCHVRWIGTLAGPGRFGHLGGSEYLMTVEKVISRELLD